MGKKRYNWPRLQLEFNAYPGSLKDFCKDKEINFQHASNKIKAKEKQNFERQVVAAAQDNLVVEFARDIKKRVARHWRLTEVIENRVLAELQKDIVEAKSLEGVLKVMHENIRLQRLIMGEPDMITSEGPKSPYEAFLAKMAREEKISEGEMEEIKEKIQEVGEE